MKQPTIAALLLADVSSAADAPLTLDEVFYGRERRDCYLARSVQLTSRSGQRSGSATVNHRVAPRFDGLIPSISRQTPGPNRG